MHLVTRTMRSHVLYYMMSANRDRNVNRRVTPRTSVLCLVALVAVRRYDVSFFMCLCLVAFTQRYALPARRLTLALRVTLSNIYIHYGSVVCLWRRKDVSGPVVHRSGNKIAGHA